MITTEPIGDTAGDGVGDTNGNGDSLVGVGDGDNTVEIRGEFDGDTFGDTETGFGDKVSVTMEIGDIVTKTDGVTINVTMVFWVVTGVDITREAGRGRAD